MIVILILKFGLKKLYMVYGIWYIRALFLFLHCRFHFHFHFHGARIKLSRDYKRANRGSHFFKAIVVLLFSIS